MAANAAKPGFHAKERTYHPSCRFQEVEFDRQTIISRTSAGKIKVLVMLDTFTRFACAVALPDEQAETIAQCVLYSWISLFSPMERMRSDTGPSFVGKVMR